MTEVLGVQVGESPTWEVVSDAGDGIGPGRRILVAVSVVAVVITADWFARVQVLSAMLDPVEATEQVMISEIPELEDLVEQFPDEVTTEAERQRVRAAIQSLYADLEADVVIAADPLEGQLLMPWWFGLREARSDYLDHAQAWRERFERIGSDPSRFSERSADISSTFRLACDALQDAVPVFDFQGSTERVQQVCAE